MWAIFMQYTHYMITESGLKIEKKKQAFYNIARQQQQQQQQEQ